MASISAGHPTIFWSGWGDLNSRPPAPKAGALPDCATSRIDKCRGTFSFWSKQSIREYIKSVSSGYFLEMDEPIYDAKTFWELFVRRVELSGDKKMLIDDSDRSLTFSEVKEKVEKTAAGFMELGVGEGTPVTWVLPTRIETIVTSLALSRIGAVQNPIIHIYRVREVGFCIRQTSSELVLVPGEWNGFDYQEMVKNSTVDMANAPKIVQIYDHLPEGGPQLFKGYKDPELNNEAFDSLGRFLTGDLGVMREDGHVSLTGRVKDIIIRKGENISAKEIEDILYTHQKVAAVAVVGLPDKERGERVCAVVELAEGNDPLELEEMIEICESEGLMKQKIPEQLINYDGLLPRNPTLKILKYQLRDEISKINWP